MLLPYAVPFRLARPMPHTILCIDDHERGLFVRKLLLQARGHRVLTALSAEAALSVLRETSVDAVVVDYHLPGMDGAVLATIIRREFPGVRIVLFSGFVPELPNFLRKLFDRIVPKAQAVPSLLKSVEEVLGLRRSKEPPTPPGSLVS